MDFEMPVMDGYEAARQIKAIHPTCRVITLTIHGGEIERQKAFESGADEFVVKGAPVDRLMEAIRHTPACGQLSKGDER
jgi:DNA-binding NarL/FixJ family response regulator